MPRNFTRALLQSTPILLGVAIAVGVALWNRGADKRALLKMPEGQRQALYERTWSSFKELCTGPNVTEFSKECRERSDFLSDFPECSTDCRDLVRELKKSQR
jgi:hypothetical protein